MKTITNTQRRWPGWTAASLIVLLAAFALRLLLENPEEPVVRERIAEAVDLHGRVERRMFLSPSWRELCERDAIFDRDEIRTLAGAHARLRFSGGTEISLAEKAVVQLKPSSLSVKAGSVESRSGDSDPFEIEAGDMRLRFRVKKSLELSLLDRKACRRLVENRLAELKTRKSAALLSEKIEKKLAGRPEESRDPSFYQECWTDMQEAGKALAAESRKKVKVSLGKGGSIRAQVNEGGALLSLSGQGGVMEMTEGLGLLVDGRSGKAKRVSLLPAPSGAKPTDGAAVFNSSEVACRWEPVPGATSYKVEISASEKFDSLISASETGTPEARIEKLETGRTYHWRVSAMDSDGFEGKAARHTFSTAEDRSPPELWVGDLVF